MLFVAILNDVVHGLFVKNAALNNSVKVSVPVGLIQDYIVIYSVECDVTSLYSAVSKKSISNNFGYTFLNDHSEVIQIKWSLIFIHTNYNTTSYLKYYII